jgi:hypothetical protein
MENMNPIETCILCGVDTQYRFNDHIDYRTGYIEGAGQLCLHCYNNNGHKEMKLVIHIDEDTILNTPNDAVLGGMVRNSYYKTKGL